jgi:hypothetical protein
VAGYFEFTTGQVLTAAQVNDFLMEQAVMTFADAAARTTALAGVLREGILTYNLDTNALERYDGSAFVKVPDAADVDAAGGLVAVKQVVKTDTQTSSSVASGASVAVTGLTITHAVADESHKVLLYAYVSPAPAQEFVYRMAATITAGGTQLNVGDADGSRTRVAGMGFAQGRDGPGNISLVALHTPGVTTAVTYGVDVTNAGVSTTTLFINRTETDTNSVGFYRGSCGLFLLEVKV